MTSAVHPLVSSHWCLARSESPGLQLDASPAGVARSLFILVCNPAVNLYTVRRRDRGLVFGFPRSVFEKISISVILVYIYVLYRVTMVIGCGFICVFAVLINKVSLQDTVEGVIGGSVVLPCSSTEHDLKPQDTDVHWRHNGSEIVYDIVKGEDSLERQDLRYKNRAESLPDEYERGNFSIKLINLIHTDAGEFSCLITHSDELQTVLLIINESTAGKESKPTEDENPEDETDSVETSLNWFFILLIVLTISILPIGCFIVFYCSRKKTVI